MTTIPYEKSFASSDKAIFWHPTLNGTIKPSDVSISSCSKKIWFKCDKCQHDFDIIPYNINNKGQWCSYCAKRRLCINEECIICFNNSFASHEKAQFWHLTKNGLINPRNIYKNNIKLFWFKCGECKHDFDIKPNDIIQKDVWCPYCSVIKKLCNDINCKFCLNNSFASCIKSKYWHQTKNEKLIPRVITKSYGKKCWFMCEICNHDFDATPSHINEGTWCPYCVNKKRCVIDCVMCYNNSFASCDKSKFWHKTKNEKITPRDVAKTCNNKYWFTCDVCNHDFDSSPGNINFGKWCPYCAICSAKLCEDIDCKFCHKKSFASHVKAKFWHPTKNEKILPRDMCISSGKKFWFNCGYCNNPFDAVLRDVSKGNWCPVCRNKTEKKLLEYLNNQYPNEVKFQPRYDWCKNPDTNCYLPFDFEIFGSIIVELDGPQHIDTQISNWKSPEEHQAIDMYKMEQALNNNKHLIRILQEDVFNDTFDWREKLNNAIVSLKYDLDTKIICIGDCDVYREYSVE